MNSFRASNIGTRYGRALSSMFPGRYPRLSPASITGLDMIILFASLFLIDLIASDTARNVLPVPGSPIQMVMGELLIALMYCCWLEVLGLAVMVLCTGSGFLRLRCLGICSPCYTVMAHRSYLRWAIPVEFSHTLSLRMR